MFSVHNFNEWDLSRLVIIEAVVIVPTVNGINLPTEMSESEDYCRFQTIIDKEPKSRSVKNNTLLATRLKFQIKTFDMIRGSVPDNNDNRTVGILEGNSL